MEEFTCLNRNGLVFSSHFFYFLNLSRGFKQAFTLTHMDNYGKSLILEIPVYKLSLVSARTFHWQLFLDYGLSICFLSALAQTNHGSFLLIVVIFFLKKKEKKMYLQHLELASESTVS